MIFSLYNAISAEHPDISDWEAESIALEFGADMVDYVCACNLLFHTDLPWENWRAFEKVCAVLNDRPVLGDVVQDMDSKEINFAVHIMKKYFPDEAFNDEVCGFMIAELLDDGVMVCPPTLSFLQDFIPKRFLTKEQEQLQLAYMNEMDTYTAIKAVEVGEKA